MSGSLECSRRIGDRAIAWGRGRPFFDTADSVAPWFKWLGHEAWFYYYLIGMIAISLVVYLFMRDTRNDSAMHRHA